MSSPANLISVQAGDQEIGDEIPGSEVPGDDVILSDEIAPESEITDNGHFPDQQPTVDPYFDELTEEV
jgi:hypothetical protein